VGEGRSGKEGGGRGRAARMMEGRERHTWHTRGYKRVNM